MQEAVIERDDDNYLSEKLFSSWQMGVDHFAVDYLNGSRYVFRVNFVEGDIARHSELDSELDSELERRAGE